MRGFNSNALRTRSETMQLGMIPHPLNIVQPAHCSKTVAPYISLAAASSIDLPHW